MEYFNRAVSYVSEQLFKRKHEEEPDVSRADAYLNLVVKVITWEDPKLTWFAFIFLNFIFTLVVYYEVKFYCFFFTTVLACVLLDFHSEFFDHKQQAKVISYRNLNDSIRDVVIYLQGLKRENPSMFCGIMMTAFLGLSFIGRMISGRVLFYIILLLVFFGQYLIDLIPESYRNKLRVFVRSLRNNEGIVAETELIPFIANKDFNAETDPDLDSLLTDRTQDSVTSSFVNGMSTMPSHLEPDCQADDLEEDDLIPQSPSSRALSYCAAEYSSDSDSEHRHMEFDSAHFNKDSSSEEEGDYTKGLKFTDVPDSSSKLVQNVSSGLLGMMGSNLLTNVLQTVASQVSASKSPPRQDSDSDFEIINSEDADDT